MRIVFTTPFRTRFSLPKDALLARHDAFVRVVEEARRELPSSGLPSPRLGNYCWGLTDPARTGDVTHGRHGTENTSWFFRNHYTLAFGDVIPGAAATGARTGGPLAPAVIAVEGGSWECRLTDNTVSIMTVTLELALGEFMTSLETARSSQELLDLTGWGTAVFRGIVEAERTSIHRALSWADEHLAAPMRAPGRSGTVANVFDILQSPLYPLPAAGSHELRPFWTHAAIVLSDDERSGLAERADLVLETVDSSPEAARWLEGGRNRYSWGTSTIVAHPRIGLQWLDSMCISQYYYACFEIADTALPTAIAAQRAAFVRGRRQSVVQRSTEIRQTLAVLTSDYQDLLVRTPGEGGAGLNGYHANWRFEKLLTGLGRKLDLLDELSHSAVASLSRSNQSRIQLILTAITMLSLIGLFSGIHDYLVAGYNPDHPEWLPSLAVTVSKVGVLAVSVLVAMLALLGYVLLNRD